ncbi:hypothetical protein AN958_12428 [Leucoagaricus sp. SymC.cos]|nr:hypothetical protein AN958_12428 [Leucoagaricus sp. SymC.cos]
MTTAAGTILILLHWIDTYHSSIYVVAYARIQGSWLTLHCSPVIVHDTSGIGPFGNTNVVKTLHVQPPASLLDHIQQSLPPDQMGFNLRTCNGVHTLFM